MAFGKGCHFFLGLGFLLYVSLGFGGFFFGQDFIFWLSFSLWGNGGQILSFGGADFFFKFVHIS